MADIQNTMQGTNVSPAGDWTDYYKRVIANPTAKPEAITEAKQKLGINDAANLPQGGNEAAGELPAIPNVDPLRFFSIMDAMSAKLKKDQGLVDMRNKVFTHLYDRPLTDEEKLSLTPDLQNAIESNDYDLINTQVRLINDEIKGRKDTLDTSIQFLTKGYEMEKEQVESRKKDSENILQTAISNYGSGFKSALSSQTISDLESMGYNIDEMAGRATLAEQKATTTGSNKTKETDETNYLRIIKGFGSIKDLTPTDRTAVENRIYNDGFYDEDPPIWFKQQIENELKKSFSKDKLKQLWDQYRKPILDRLKDSSSSSSREL